MPPTRRLPFCLEVLAVARCLYVRFSRSPPKTSRTSTGSVPYPVLDADAIYGKGRAFSATAQG